MVANFTFYLTLLQTASSGIWTQVTYSIPYIDNPYVNPFLIIS